MVCICAAHTPNVVGSASCANLSLSASCADCLSASCAPVVSAHREIATATVVGSGLLAMDSDEHPIALMNKVCSPGGTTIEGVCKLKELGFETAVQQGLKAIIEKDIQLSKN